MIGSALTELDTPALLLDRGALERNLRRLAEHFRDRRCRLRPHFKNHKCTEIARRQIAAGSAVGMTCAKLGEAEVLADAGFDDVLIANQVVGGPKLRRLVDLAKRAKVRVAVDDIEQVRDISHAMSGANASVGLLIEVDIGMGRCGVPPGEPALALAREIVRLSGVRLDGIQAYEGHLVGLPDPQERARRTRAAMQDAIDTRRLIERAGIPVAVISGGSTATYATTGSLEGVDEIQAGTYATMDCFYRRISPEFEQALTVLTRVISRPRPGVAVLDVGVKGVGHEFGPPEVHGCPTAKIPRFLSEEHCIVHDAPDWRIGQLVELVPSHACTTCNLYRRFCVHEDRRVVEIWPIEASGCLA